MAVEAIGNLNCFRCEEQKPSTRRQSQKQYIGWHLEDGTFERLETFFNFSCFLPRQIETDPTVVRFRKLQFKVRSVLNALDKGAMPSLLCYNCIHYYYCHDLTQTKYETTLASPLMVALMVNDVKACKLFTSLRFLNMKDLYFRREYMEALRSRHSQPMPRDTLIRQYYSSPWSLQTLSFVHVSTMLGYRSDRKERVSALTLPNRFKRELMFGNC